MPLLAMTLTDFRDEVKKLKDEDLPHLLSQLDGISGVQNEITSVRQKQAELEQNLATTQQLVREIQKMMSEIREELQMKRAQVQRAALPPDSDPIAVESEGVSGPVRAATSSSHARPY